MYKCPWQLQQSPSAPVLLYDALESQARKQLPKPVQQSWGEAVSLPSCPGLSGLWAKLPALLLLPRVEPWPGETRPLLHRSWAPGFSRGGGGKGRRRAPSPPSAATARGRESSRALWRSSEWTQPQEEQNPPGLRGRGRTNSHSAGEQLSWFLPGSAPGPLGVKLRALKAKVHRAGQLHPPLPSHGFVALTAFYSTRPGPSPQSAPAPGTLHPLLQPSPARQWGDKGGDGKWLRPLYSDPALHIQGHPSSWEETQISRASARRHHYQQTLSSTMDKKRR